MITEHCRPAAFARIPAGASVPTANRCESHGTFLYRLNSLLPAIAIVLMILPVAKTTIDTLFTVGVLSIWVAVAVIQRPGWLSRMSGCFYVVPFWAAYAWYQVAAAGSDVKVVGGYVLFIATALVYDYYHEDRRALALLTVAGILSFLGGAVMSIQVLLVDPMAARLVTSGFVRYLHFEVSGVGGYRFAYGLAMLFPLLIATTVGAGVTLRQRVLTLACSCVFACHLYLASFGLSIGIMIAGVLAALFCQIRSRNLRLVVSLATIFAGVLLVTGLGADLMFSVSARIPNETLSRKGGEIASLLSGTVEGGSDVSTRSMLYLSSIATFIDHPFTGGGAFFNAVGDDRALDQGIGGHSEWLDTLARFGLIGAGLLLFSVFHLALRSAVVWKGTTYGSAARKMWLIFVLFGFFNPVLGITEIGVVVFLLWPALPHAFRRRQGISRRIPPSSRRLPPRFMEFAT